MELRKGEVRGQVGGEAREAAAGRVFLQVARRAGWKRELGKGLQSVGRGRVQARDGALHVWSWWFGGGWSRGYSCEVVDWNIKRRSIAESLLLRVYCLEFIAQPVGGGGVQARDGALHASKVVC